ncbi:hypothetical protein NA56DRAFT_705245 [Hyaloscypha hepaticicola]|uniref:Uncharacterized protein n=1 Tax=Hyaloscypha hepaticicola TaxID=2082293 RepID=A0A2J6Q1B0_9HELO|nr:hypothetical protein NA56DRAFT_705245 [Hyaloscypha hepaticicola]
MPLDPLSALSVVASVVQFLDFSNKIVSKGVQAYKSSDGALIENAQIEEATQRLAQLSKNLETSMVSDQGGVLSDTDQQLATICQSCVSVTSELITYLEKLKIPNWQQHRKWTSFRKALKSVWSTADLDRTVHRLDVLKGELETHVLVSLRQQVTTLTLKNDNHFDTLYQGMQRAINTLLQQSNTVDEIVVQLRDLKISYEREHVDLRTSLAAEKHQNRKSRVVMALLESLRFPSMGDREGTVAKAYQKTFEWNFKDPSSKFSEWLKAGTDTFWIQGKAGSGKSTLIRFITTHSKIGEYLDSWSPNGSTDTATSFFWKSGVAEQRSLVGLLRSLLWEMLSNRPELITHVFPEDWKRLYILEEHGLPLNIDTWSVSRLQNAFRNLVGQANEHLKFCFFIDGLDELEGDQSDHASITAFLQSFTPSLFVKFCVSSRPWPVFSHFFEKCPGLKLQDLTKADIMLYVQGTLEKDEEMLQLLETEEFMATQLIEKIVHKADGVFLWVTLVVKSLLNGLMNGDGITTLRQRLDCLPPDLESLYAHMLGNIDEIYMQEASKIFQLRRASVKRWTYLTIKMLDICLNPIFESVKSTDTSSESYSKKQVKRLDSRCGGLLEAQFVLDWEGFRYASDRNELVVQYLHRTVADYIQNSDVWNRLLVYTAGCEFEPYELLLKSRILVLKKQLSGRVINDPDFGSYRWEDFKHFLNHEEPIDANKEVALVDEFDKTITESMAMDTLHRRTGGTGQHWSSPDFPPMWNVDMLSLAIVDGLHTYVETKLTLNPALMHKKRVPPLLAFGLKWITMERRDNAPRMVKILLDHGADPNELYDKYTLWEYTVQYAHSIGDGFTRILWQYSCEKWLEIFKLMLQHGADANVCCFKDGRAWDKLYGDGQWFRPGRYGTLFERVSPNEMEKLLIRGAVHYAVMNDDFHSPVVYSEETLGRHPLVRVVQDVFGGDSQEELERTAELVQLIEASRQSNT